ncbi:MAG: hypothetical protein JJU00_11430 [Opitutales bacterium]|nr:hypothetical protein [Opitutales bacterium]
MAWRIAEQVVEGEIDNRTKGRVTGWIRLVDGGELRLELTGNAWPDIAGSRIRFRNREPARAEPQGLHPEQEGRAGDITASRKVKDLLVPVETFLEMPKAERESALTWANGLYLEWFSRANGRVVIESTRFDTEIVDGPRWTLSEEDRRAQAESGADAMRRFMEDAAGAVAAAETDPFADEDEFIPPAEAEMDAEAARMDLLSDRIERRLRKNWDENVDWGQIYEEESARLRRERGEPEPDPPTPEEEAEAAAWIEEMNAAAKAAEEEAEAEAWKARERRRHPLVLECREYALQLREECELPADASPEHPFCELMDGVLFASGKLAGALGICEDEEEWPPDALQAPSVLVFLKKARGYLRDALRALDSIDEEALGTAAWRKAARAKVDHLLRETHRLILEARRSLQ